MNKSSEGYFKDREDMGMFVDSREPPADGEKFKISDKEYQWQRGQSAGKDGMEWDHQPNCDLCLTFTYGC